MIFGFGWRGDSNEKDMTDEDWSDRAARLARDMIQGVPVEDAVTDRDGTPTYGCYNDDYSDQEHKDANRRYEEDPDYAEEVADGVRVLNWLKEEGFL